LAEDLVFGADYPGEGWIIHLYFGQITLLPRAAIATFLDGVYIPLPFFFLSCSTCIEEHI
jgi:hypothetical protein